MTIDESQIGNTAVDVPPSDVIAAQIRHGLRALFEVHWPDSQYIKELQNGGDEPRDDVQLLNEALQDWIGPGSDLLDRFNSSERSCIELARAAWQPFWECIERLRMPTA